MKINNEKLFTMFSLTFIHTINAPLPCLFQSFFRGIPSLIPNKLTFSRL